MVLFNPDDPFAAIARSLGNQHGELETVEKALAVAVELIEAATTPASRWWSAAVG